MTQTSLLDVDARPVALRRPHDAARGASPHASLLGRPIEGDGTGTYAPLATWAIVSAIALAAGALLGGHAAPAIAAGLGGLVAVLVVPFERYGRLLTLAALVPAALATSFAPAWVLAGALVAYAVGRSRAPVVVAMNDLERHLSWCRRRDEQADVLAVRIDGTLHDPERVVRAFRITDSVELRRRAGGYDLTAVLDHQDLDRAGIERRLAGLGIAPISWGWALFPRDGFTLDVLVERARRPAPAAAEPPERDERQSAAAAQSRNVA